MNYLYEELEKYCKDDYYPFHMPGHKRNTKYLEMMNPYGFDITEINGFDNLHHAEEILKTAQDRAARVYGADETHFLINGSTAGLLSAVSACVDDDGILLMARNSHKAVYHSVYVNKIKNIYTYPQNTQKKCVNCGIITENIKEILKKNKKIQAVLITSPTYDGVVSDIEGIAKVVHSYNIPLIVDEAHGAHFPFSDAFPVDSIKAGADIVIHSVHKTMPSLTQTALIHVNGNIVNREKLRKYLGIFQTSSPSYVLMSSIDNCIRLVEEKGPQLFSEYEARLNKFRNSLSDLKNLYLVNKEDLECFDYDNSKIIISTEKVEITGKELHDILLNKYHLEMEMSTNNYCLAMTSIMDTDEGFERFKKALYEIDETLNDKIIEDENPQEHFLVTQENKKVLEIWQAERLETKSVALCDSIGKVAGEYVYLYPPGIPLIVPGEEISEQFVNMIKVYKEMKLNIEGMEDYTCSTIKIVSVTGM